MQFATVRAHYICDSMNGSTSHAFGYDLYLVLDQVGLLKEVVHQ